MHKVEITMSANVSAEKIWQVLKDFEGFLNWARLNGGEILVEGDGIGMIRHLKTDVGEIGEQLTALDNDSRQIGYQITYGEPIGMKSYKALVTLNATGNNICEINWSGIFAPVDSETTKQVETALSDSYQKMHLALESYTLMVP